MPEPISSDQAEVQAELTVNDLRIAFANTPVVDRVSLVLRRGEVLALVGESGSGKSMTARAILGLLPDTAQVTGTIDYDDRDLLALSERDLDPIRGARIAMVFQEPQTALNPVRTIGWQLKEALRAHGVRDREEIRRRSVQLLAEVEIPDPAERLGYYPHQLSGGQKQRVVLALALANEPRILLADEPTTALDVTVQAEILKLLARIRERHGTSVLLITHNMGVVAQTADRVVVMKAGRVVETGTTKEVFTGPRDTYTRTLLASVLRLPVVGEAAPGPAALEPAEIAAVEFTDVSVRYGSRSSGFLAVDGVSLAVAPGEVVGLVGESGSGKTTLGRVAAGLVGPTAGEVRVDGRDLFAARGAERRRLRRGLAFVHQDPEASLDPLSSIGESIREPLDVHGIGTAAERDERVRALLDDVQLPAAFAQRRPRELSGGQRQRVALARALALEPALLIADEPTSALDVSVQARVLALFAQVQREHGFACLFISHDLAVVHKVADRAVVLRSGKVVETGSPQAVFTRPRADYTRSLVDAVPVPEVSLTAASSGAGK